MHDLRHFIETLEIFQQLYRRNERSAAKHHMLCTKYIKYTEQIAMAMPALYFVSVTAFTCFVLYDFLSTAHWDVIDSPLFACNCAILVGASVIAIAGVIVGTFDATVLVTFCNLALFSDIIVAEIHASNEYLTRNAHDDVLVRRRLLEIVQMHRQYKE